MEILLQTNKKEINHLKSYNYFQKTKHNLTNRKCSVMEILVMLVKKKKIETGSPARHVRRLVKSFIDYDIRF